MHPGNYGSTLDKQSNSDCMARNTNTLNVPERQCLKNKLWEYKNYTAVANYYNVSTTQVRRWCRKYNLPANVNIIKYTSDTGWENENWNDVQRTKCSVEQEKPCCMLDIDTGDVIMEFPSREAAARYLNVLSKNAASNISKACSNQHKIAYGYRWKNK